MVATPEVIPGEVANVLLTRLRSTACQQLIRVASPMVLNIPRYLADVGHVASMARGLIAISNLTAQPPGGLSACVQTALKPGSAAQKRSHKKNQNRDNHHRRRMPRGLPPQFFPGARRPSADWLAGEETVEIVGQLAGARVPPPRLFLQALQHDRVQRNGQVAAPPPEWRRIIGDDLPQRVELGLTAKRRPSGQELIKDASQSVNIGGRPDLGELPLGLLGRHVGRRAERHAAPGVWPQAVGELCQAEIRDARLEIGEWNMLIMIGLGLRPRALEEDVTGLEVAVKDAPLVGVLDGPRERGDQPRGVVSRHRPRLARQPESEGRTGDVGGRDIGDRVDGASLVDGDDVGVVETGGGVGLSLKPLSRLGRSPRIPAAVP